MVEKRRLLLRFFLQWAIFSIIGMLAVPGLGLLVQHLNFNIPDMVIFALIPAYVLFPYGDYIGEPTTTAKILTVAVVVLDALYYGLVLLIVWRVLCFLLKRTGSRPKSA
jgi:hypothetical protein